MFKQFLKDQGLIADTPATPTPVPVSSIASAVSVIPNTAGAVPTAQTDAAAYKVLMDKVNQSTVAGYEDFATMNTDLQTDIPDANVRARTAIKSVTRMRGITPQNILESVDDRIRRLDEADKHIQASLSDLLVSELATKDAAIAAVQSEKDKLEKQIADLRAKESTLQSERKLTEVDLRKKQEILRTTAQTISAQLTRDRAVISANLN